MVDRDSEIVAKILSMSSSELDDFVSRLKPETLDYLDVLLAKAETGVNTSKLKRYLTRKSK